MGKEIIMFGNIEVEKNNFHQYKNPVPIYDANIDKLVVSRKFPFGKKGFKYYFGYKDAKKVRPLCVMLPKMSAYSRDFDEIKYMFFFFDKKGWIAKKYNKILDNFTNSLKKGFDSEHVYNEKYKN